MIRTFDILKIRDDGVDWMACAASLNKAKTRVEALKASSPGDYLIFTQETWEKRRIFQIGDEDKEREARAALFRRLGHAVMSMGDYEAAKIILRAMRPRVDLFIVGHTARNRTRKEMVRWLKTNYPKSKIVALSPSGVPVPKADYSVKVNGYEWMALVTAAAAG